MKKYFWILLLMLPLSLWAQDNIVGTWKAIDDKDGQPSSYISIYEQGGKIHGKVKEILKQVDGPAVCDLCEGAKKGQPVEGLEIIWDMEWKGSSYKGGRILDPENGKTYKCRIKLVDNILEVRGYIGIPTLGRTQKWYPMEG